MNSIKIELSVDETNLVLRALGSFPFNEVANLINKIKAQGDPQVDALQKVQKNNK